MKETGESGSTKNKTVVLLLIILLILIWFVVCSPSRGQ